MKPTIILLSLFPITAFAQVGINTDNPKSTLHVMRNTLNNTVPDGIIAPQLTGNNIKANDNLYGNDQMGAIVYITEATNPTSAKTINMTSTGYYYFDGTVWVKLGSENATNIITADNGLTKTVDNVQLGGTLLKNTDISTASYNTTFSGSGKFGIGTINPITKLDVQGNLRIGTATSSGGSSNVSTLVRDNTTGEVKVAVSSTGNVSPINYVVYTISNVNGDWINDFDTKISAADYTMTVVGNSFDNKLQATGTAPDITYAPSKVYAFQSGGTWRLTADYINTTTSAGTNGTWIFYCLIISNSLVKTLAPISQNLGGSNNGTAGLAPTGL